jgi:hypothetical protein
VRRLRLLTRVLLIGLTAVLTVAVLMVFTLASLMSKRTRKLLDASSRWQDEQLGILERKTYAELAALPPRTPLPCPLHLKGLKFHVSRKPGDNGGVEISVREYTRFLNTSEGSAGPSFEMLPDGSVIHDV